MHGEGPQYTYAKVEAIAPFAIDEGVKAARLPADPRDRGFIRAFLNDPIGEAYSYVRSL